MTSIILNVYSKNAMQTFKLPVSSLQKFVCHLDYDLFNINYKLDISLEKIGDFWTFSESKKYYILNEQKIFFLKQIQNNGSYILLTSNKDMYRIFVTEVNENQLVLEKYLFENISQISISHDNTGDITLLSHSFFQKTNIVFKKQAADWYIEAKNMEYGPYVNGKAVQQQQLLQFGDIIHCCFADIVFLNDLFAFKGNFFKINNPVLKKAEYEDLKWISHILYKNRDNKSVLFHKAPRNLQILQSKEILVDSPPTIKAMPKRSLIMVIGPSLSMLIPMIIGVVIVNGAPAIGLLTMSTSAIIGGLWAFINYKQQNKKMLKTEENRRTQYAQYINSIEKEADQLVQKNREILIRKYPSSLEMLDNLREYLWIRNKDHDDFLFERLGTADIPSPIKIITENHKFNMLSDDLLNEPQRLSHKYQRMKNVPYGIDMQNYSAIGIIGKNLYDILRNFIVQICTNNHYEDVKVGFVGSEFNQLDQVLVQSIKYLPHVWNQNHDRRFIALNKKQESDLMLYVRDEYILNPTDEKDFLILFKTNAAAADESTLFKINSKKQSHHMCMVYVTEKFENLPHFCQLIIENSQSFKGTYDVDNVNQSKTAVLFDHVNHSQLNTLSRYIASIKTDIVKNEQDIPTSISFLEMYHVNSIDALNIKERWQQARSDKTLNVPIGCKALNQLTFLDLHENGHGPHGLVAGTTGSGKSETLQTLILSLAVNFSPLEISFFIIDYKGGGMANQFSALPHIAGTISNLSGNLIKRALTSLRSEIERRQKLLASYHENNINAYIKKYKKGEITVPLPHLIIIIDEFAELKKNEPEFMNEIISISRVGRSLGIHLILSTQRPAGAVSDDIWANANFRLCLRVQDKQDSMDMLKNADASYITKTGRGFLQVGNDGCILYELFQSGWSGANYSIDGFPDESIADLYSIDGKKEIQGHYFKAKQRMLDFQKWLLYLQKIINHVFDEKKLTLAMYFSDVSIQKLVHQDIFEMLEKINFPKTAANEKKIDDYISVLASLKEPFSENIPFEFLIQEADRKHLDLPKRPKETQLEALVKYIDQLAKELKICTGQPLWLPPLPKRLILSQIDDQAKTHEMVSLIGKYDDPRCQRQSEVVVDFVKNGHYILCGKAGSGKSTLLQTLIFSLVTRFSPLEVNLYIIDFSSGFLSVFKQSPNVGDIITDSNIDQISRLLIMLEEMSIARKKAVAGEKYEHYLKRHPHDFPTVIIVIDNYPEFARHFEMDDEKRFISLLNNGQSVGIYFVISGKEISGNEIPSRISHLMNGMILLEMKNKMDYFSMFGQKADVILEENMPGRGLVKIDGRILEFQTALAVDAENDYARGQMIEKICMEMRSQKPGLQAKKIPQIPEHLDFLTFLKQKDITKTIHEKNKLPIGYSLKTALPVIIDATQCFCFMVSGMKNTGKTNFLYMLARILIEKNETIYLVDSESRTLERFEGKPGIKYIACSQDMVKLCNDIIPVIQRRNKIISSAKKSNRLCDIDQMMQSEPMIYIIIDDMKDFLKMVYETSDAADIIRPLEILFEKAKNHRIMIAGAFDSQEVNEMLSHKLFSYFIKDGTGIHFGGAVDRISYMNFMHIPYKKQLEKQKTGMGYLVSQDGTLPLEEILTPYSEQGE